MSWFANYQIRDLDQIKADLTSPKHLKQYKDSKLPEDLPDLGKNYCVSCAKWFEAASTLSAHQRGKPHKRRYIMFFRCSQ